MNQKKEEINKAQEELKQEKIEREQTKVKLERTKEELSQYKIELIKFSDEKKYHTQNIVVGGFDRYNQVGGNPNNKSIICSPIISPPIILSFDNSKFYTVYDCHSVICDGCSSLMGIGKNVEGRISSSLQKTVIDHLTEFSIKDGSGLQLDPVSAVVTSRGTLYMFSKMKGNGKQLVLCDQDINGGDPVFLDIGNLNPVALFGGRLHSASICSEGEIIFINRDSIRKSPESRIEAVSLPDGEKASSVACCNDSIVVLSSNGRVFSSHIEVGSGILRFSEVDELKGKEIVCVSGTNDHFLAVSKEGQVFGCGSNDHCKLGIGKGITTTPSFTEISLEGYKIREAYAGGQHSLFETQEGKILSCGWNQSGQLLLSSGPSEDVYQITETMITGGATFCIAGWCLSAVFIGREPPSSNPNIRIMLK